MPAKVTRLYYGFQFFFSLLFWVPIFYEFQKRVGLSDAQIFTIQSLYYLAFCVLEIPTGFIADRFGYRSCLRWGSVLLVASNLFPVFSPTYLGFVAHFIVIALSRSLISGASSAYIYEHLKARGAADAYKQVEGNARAYGLIGKVVCWVLVGRLMQWWLPAPYVLTAVAALISVGFAYRLPADSGLKNQVRESLELTEGLRILGRSPVIFLVMLQGIAIFVMTRIYQVNLFQPILQAKGFGLSSYGVVMSVMTLFEAFGAARPGLIRQLFSDLNSVYALTLLMAFCLVLIPVSGQLGTVLALSLFSLAVGFSFPIQRQLLNDLISEVHGANYRATLLSLESILDRAVCAWSAMLLGSYAGAERQPAFIYSSAILAVGTVFFVFAALFFMARRATA